VQEEPAVAEQKVVGLTPNPPAPDDWVEIEHDGIDGTTRVHPRTLPHWMARKWRVVKRDVEAPITAEQEGAAEQESAAAAAAPTTTPTTATKRSARPADPGTEG
jgi:hypothetical protein